MLNIVICILWNILHILAHILILNYLMENRTEHQVLLTKRNTDKQEQHNKFTMMGYVHFQYNNATQSAIVLRCTSSISHIYFGRISTVFLLSSRLLLSCITVVSICATGNNTNDVLVCLQWNSTEQNILWSQGSKYENFIFFGSPNYLIEFEFDIHIRKLQLWFAQAQQMVSNEKSTEIGNPAAHGRSYAQCFWLYENTELRQRDPILHFIARAQID